MEKIIKVYDRDNYFTLINGLKVLQINKINNLQPEKVIEIPKLEELNISSSLCCSFCKINFEDCIQQRQHYKSDWHRYNLKLNLKSQEPITEDKFDQQADDVSSISGSDSESDDNSEQDNSRMAASLGKIFFRNEDGKFFSMYRSLLHEKKDNPANDDALLKLVRQNVKNIYWTILMLGGGHFAGAVFNGSEILVHKTFHCYTCRAKQGGSQASRDSKGGSASSAGASLRRYNEQALVQHVTNLVETWSSHIDKSNIIFYRAAGPYNRTVLFGGKNPILKKNDPRLRNVPFSTKRPTFSEVKRVHDILTNIEVFNSSDSLLSQFIPQKPVEENNDSPNRSRRESPKNKNINRAKSREMKERPLPGMEELSESSDSENFHLESEDLELNFSDLKQYEDTVPLKIKQEKAAKKKKPKKKDRVKKWEENLKKELYRACSKGDLEELINILHGIKDDSKENDENTQIGFLKAINMCIDEHGNTPLHIAALNNKTDLILWLMENNATPCCKNDKQNTPYTINSDKEIRNVFRKFAVDFPEKYNYAKSSIPVIVSTMTEEELAEKKKAQRKAKREREKEKKKENDIKRKEEDERNRFVTLSDREKRALAAERRLLAQTSTVLARCFLCGEDISGKVPFEYSGNRFCTISCLKAHRMNNPVVLS